MHISSSFLFFLNLLFRQTNSQSTWILPTIFPIQFTKKKKKNLSRLEIKQILRGSKSRLMFVRHQEVGLTPIEPNHRLNGVNARPSRQTIKTNSSCTDNPLNINTCFIYLFNTQTRHSRTNPLLPLSFEKNLCWTLTVEQ